MSAPSLRCGPHYSGDRMSDDQQKQINRIRKHINIIFIMIIVLNVAHIIDKLS